METGMHATKTRVRETKPVWSDTRHWRSGARLTASHSKLYNSSSSDRTLLSPGRSTNPGLQTHVYTLPTCHASIPHPRDIPQICPTTTHMCTHTQTIENTLPHNTHIYHTVYCTYMHTYYHYKIIPHHIHVL